MTTKLSTSALTSSNGSLFLPECGGPRSRIPIPQTCRPTKQTLLLNNSNKSVDAHQRFFCVSSEEYYVTGENTTEGLTERNSNVLVTFYFFPPTALTLDSQNCGNKYREVCPLGTAFAPNL